MGANTLTGLKGEGLDIQRLEFVALWHSQSLVFQGYKFSGDFPPKGVKKARITKYKLYILIILGFLLTFNFNYIIHIKKAYEKINQKTKRRNY